jgi:magnesium and cobalt transporter
MSEPPSHRAAVPRPTPATAPATAPAPPHAGPSHKHRSLLERIGAFVFREPESRDDLLAMLADAHERNLLDADALSMIEGVLQVARLRAVDLLVPSAQVEVIDLAEPPSVWLPHAIAAGHSRFPVIEGDRDHVLGILLAKDLLRLFGNEQADVRAMLRPAMFIPESKPLNVLLREFRINRNHMAIVVDEYGGVAGLITIEDVLEQIVGDIDDEYDFDVAADNIMAEPDGRWRVKAHAPLAQFNEAFGCALASEGSETIGGLLNERLGRVPRRGDLLELADLRVEVLRADARHAHLLQVERLAKTVVEEFAESGQATERDRSVGSDAPATAATSVPAHLD